MMSDKSYNDDLQAPDCEDCECRMVKRTRKDNGDQFYGCPNFPDCKNTMPLDWDDDSYAQHRFREEL